MYVADGKYTEAAPLFVQLVSMEEKVLGPDAPILAETLSAYAAAQRKLGRDAEAVKLEERARQIMAKSKVVNTGKPDPARPRSK